MSEEKKSTYDGYTEARKKANKKYMSKLVDIHLPVPPERRDLIKEQAGKQNESMSAFINRAIAETLKRDSDS